MYGETFYGRHTAQHQLHNKSSYRHSSEENAFTANDDCSRFYLSVPMTTIVVPYIPAFSGAVSNDSREVPYEDDQNRVTLVSDDQISLWLHTMSKNNNIHSGLRFSLANAGVMNSLKGLT